LIKHRQIFETERFNRCEFHFSTLPNYKEVYMTARRPDNLE